MPFPGSMYAPLLRGKTGCDNKIIPLFLSLQGLALGVELLTNGFKKGSRVFLSYGWLQTIFYKGYSYCIVAVRVISLSIATLNGEMEREKKVPYIRSWIYVFLVY